MESEAKKEACSLALFDVKRFIPLSLYSPSPSLFPQIEIGGC